MIDTSTKFPTDIDDLKWFQDVHLKDVQAVKIYNQLIKEKQYSAASTLLSSGMYGGMRYDVPTTYSADLLNMFELRLLEIEKYIKDFTKVHIGENSTSEPTNPKVKFWTC